MKALRVSMCPLCGVSIARGDDIAAFCGEWVHNRCKRRRLNQLRAASGGPQTVPQDRNREALDRAIQHGRLTPYVTPSGNSRAH